MKATSFSPIPTARLFGAASGWRAEEVFETQCPEAVLDTIELQVGDGRVGEIKRIPMESGAVYLAEILREGPRKRVLHIAADGTLLEVVDELGLRDLPRRVKSAITPLLDGGIRFDCADRVTGHGRMEFHVDLDLEDDVDLHLVVGEGGEILRRYEEGDF
jgi:hypothetical protein